MKLKETPGVLIPTNTGYLLPPRTSRAAKLLKKKRKKKETEETNI